MRAICCWVLLTLGATAWANPGEDGNITITASGQVINAYAPLATAVTAGSTTLRVADVANLALPASSGVAVGNRPLGAGDLLMVYQPQGASIDTTIDSSPAAGAADYGGVTAYGGAGLWEFVYVASVDTAATPDIINIATTSTCGGLANAYSIGGTGVAAAMVIRVPQYRNLTINAGASVVAGEWDGSTGGVVAAHVAGTTTDGVLTVNGQINVSGQGFRGGIDPARTTTVDGTTALVCTDASGAGGQKGEGIAGSWAALSGGSSCRGAPANGGGGADGHNSGGGGGANGCARDGGGINCAVSWTGTGIPDRGTSNAYDDSWNLEAAGFATSSSSGGGRGGYTWGGADIDENTSAPGAGGSGGDSRRNVGGFGGRSLLRQPGGSSSEQPRFYFGGGGGAGDANNNEYPAGGDGGGLVFVIARRLAGSGSILANGAQGQDDDDAVPSGITPAPDTCCGDAPGGGGAGGSVVLVVNTGGSSTVTVQANGGRGGNQTAVNNPGNESEGGGGGGGGGVVAITTGLSTGTRSASAGVNGTTVATAVNNQAGVGQSCPGATCGFPPNGATGGAAGETAVTAPTRSSRPFQCLQDNPFPTPVSNASFRATRVAGSLQVVFETAAEAGNLGFRLYAESREGARLQPLGGLIQSQAIDSSVPQRYSVEVPDPGADRLYLADLSVTGEETLRGPFQIESSYGSAPAFEAIDWRAAREAAALRRAPTQGNVALATVSQRGMQQIRHEDLLAVGVDLSGIPAAELAVTGRHGAVPRRIFGGVNFGPGSLIEFYAAPRQSLYAVEERFQILRARDAVREIPRVASAASNGQPGRHQAELRFEPERNYGFSSPTADPWFAERLLANGQPLSREYSLQAETDRAGPGWIEVEAWGGNDMPGTGPDHHLRVHFNDQLVGSVQVDGLQPIRLRLPVTVQAGANRVRLELPNDLGQPLDLIHLDRIVLSHEAPTVASAGRFFGAAVQIGSDALFADGFGDVVASTASGGALQLAGIGAGARAYRIIDGMPAWLDLYGGAAVAAAALRGELWLSTPEALHRPALSATITPAPPSAGTADYVVLTHAAFESALAPLLARRQAQGLRPLVVDVAQVYALESAGNVDPAALQRYLARIAAQTRLRYVLLVGGDSYDYRDDLGLGSVSFVPSFYTRTSAIIAFAPSDGLLVDFNRDGRPDLPIGRLPVRTLAEAEEAVRKLLAYENQPVRERALLVAGGSDADLDFAQALRGFDEALPQPYERRYVVQDQLGLAAARAELVQAMNAGSSLLGFVGHSAPAQWTFDPLFRATDVATLAANANQPLVLQFGCWTTYYVSPQANTMAHRLLLTPARGAAAVFGAAVLMDQASHDRMAAALAPVLIPGQRLGDAIQLAREKLPIELREAQLGTVLLGDPAMPLR